MVDRTCPGCAINDDHPRHQAVTEAGDIAAWHTDCHAAKGCPECTIARQGAENLTGDEYREHLVANGAAINAAIQELPENVRNEVFGKVS
ncbi:hypothetical protein L3Q65_46200 [Amycolatopsis sp. FU40]|uniref:hypothetical protein n=1 Tax=Amycolatopsis sp. FU40 TaxID=2914159 RepID=UPI001F3E104A|nr:hypothetical protein [Amycolatopsis sp. FU40]UKD55168.1 hypothetical protein L3Q65_46200 [Amycolatopsis sp. FU40]